MWKIVLTIRICFFIFLWLKFCQQIYEKVIWIFVVSDSFSTFAPENEKASLAQLARARDL